MVLFLLILSKIYILLDFLRHTLSDGVKIESRMHFVQYADDESEIFTHLRDLGYVVRGESEVEFAEPQQFRSSFARCIEECLGG